MKSNKGIFVVFMLPLIFGLMFAAVVVPTEVMFDVLLFFIAPIMLLLALAHKSRVTWVTVSLTIVISSLFVVKEYGFRNIDYSQRINQKSLWMKKS